MTTRTIRNIDPIASTDDSDRLALLWRAFEEAEQRIAELERDLDRARRAPAPTPRPAVAPTPRPAPVAAPAPAPVAPRATDAELVAAQTRLRESHEREARLVGELAEARRNAEAEAARYLAAMRVIQHEAGRARASMAERDAAQVSLRDARTRLAILEAERVEVAEARGRLIEQLRETEDELALQRAATQRAETRLALEDLAREIDAAVARGKAARPEPAVVIAPPRAPPAFRPTRLYPVAAGHVAQIPGIHAHEVEGLRLAGVNMMDALLYADLSVLAVTSDVGLARLARHRSLAEIIALDGIGPEWAERLFRAGVRGIDDVAAMDAARLEAVLMRSYDEDGLSEEARTLLARTLPARAEAVVREAREVVASWR